MTATQPSGLPRLLITRELPAQVITRAQQYFVVTLWPEDRPIGAELTRLARAQDALLVMSNDRVDASLLAGCAPGLRAIATYSAGFDHIDIATATRYGIPVFTTPNVLSEAVAEIALYLILGAARRTRRAESVLRGGEWGPWSPSFMVGMQLTGRRLGIYGMGAIGREIAKRASSFGLKIHYFNRQRLPLELEMSAVYCDSLESLMACSDIFCVAAPSTPETRSSVNRERMSLLPRGALLVNIARGDLVDEDALLELVGQGHIANVGLDVFRGEPHIDSRWLDLPEALLLPHIGSSSEVARVDMGLTALAALEQHFVGAVPPNCLNPSVYTKRPIDQPIAKVS